MKRRELLKNIPIQEKTQENAEEKPTEDSKEFEESEVFKLPDEESKKVEKSDNMEVKPKRARGNPEGLKKGREVALENRRKKKEERDRLKAEEKTMMEMLKYKELHSKYGVKPKPEPPKVEEPKQEEVKPPEPQRHIEPVEDLRKKMERETSITSNSIQHTIDYDRIISGLAERMERKTLSDKEVQERIKKQAQEEAQKEVNVYKERYNSLQRHNAVNALTKRNPVFERSANLRNTYTSRFSNNWYRR